MAKTNIAGNGIMKKLATKSPKKCIFCNVNNAGTKEHFYSDWMSKLFEKNENPYNYSRKAVINPDHTVVSDETTRKQGHLYRKRFRIVCGKCNGGWMKKFEDDAIPFLSKLILGESIIINKEQMAIIARWATLKTIVSEHDAGSDPITPLGDRIALMESGEIPKYYQIYLANHIHPEQVKFARHSHFFHLERFKKYGPYPRIEDVSADDLVTPAMQGNPAPNMQQATWLLGKVLLHVNVVLDHPWFIEKTLLYVEGLYNSACIWPLSPPPLTWPRLPCLDRDDVEQLMRGLAFSTPGPFLAWKIEGGKPFW
ncbi:hypothetical protein [Oleomonas cavernae]|uniref:hypothetical protein n=1 Tax=Oleomonas cavernae TaxID=2320859 RepID=UPI0011C34710|nr:hypothetical protein [Oleomonas cavernae]